MQIDERDNYYLKNKKKLMKEFSRLAKNRKALDVLETYIDASSIDRFVKEWSEEYEKLIPQIPYIGGKKNDMTRNLIYCTFWLAMYKKLKQRGMETREIGKIIYEMMEAYFESMNFMMKKLAKAFFYLRLRNERKNRDNKNGQYSPHDWIWKYVEGDGKTFFQGTDYRECGIITFYRQHDAEEIIPYICITDYAMFRALGIGFKRTETIGMGGEKCDFRYVKNYETPRGWPPEEREEFQKYLSQKS
jgi:hypothetical protein